MRFRRLLALVLTFVIMLSMSTVTLVTAAEVPDVSGMIETAISIPASGGVTSTAQSGSGDSFNGYIYSAQQAEVLAASYLKVTYTVDGDAPDDTEVFTFQPFNSSWGGWQNNFVTIGNSAKEGNTYTAYMAVKDVKASLTEGSLMGINISFVEPPSGVTVTITGYSYLTPPSGLPDTLRDWLEYSINYSKALDPAKYQAASFAAFQTAITTAENTLKNASDSAFQAARDNLEKAKAKLLFADSAETGNPQPFRELTGQETVAEMGVGWNLGNTMDGHAGFHPGETAWQQSVTTKEMIRAIHDAGFNTIRIPVTWGDMIDDENGYAINDAWINRVQDIVDYCVDQDMYAIINIHHDGAEQSGWLRVASDNIDFVYEKYECVWRNIAEHFKDYDEHLIFESANELTCMEDNEELGTSKNSSEAQAKDTPIIMNLNQIFVNVVRSTGSNNTKRWLAAVSHYANRGTSYGFALPIDSYNSTNRLMFAQHIYKETNLDTYAWTNAKQLTDVVQQSYKKFPDVPIILGEYGTKNRKYSGNPSGYNDIGRAYYFECATRAGQVGMTVPCVWDQGLGNATDAKATGLYNIWWREENRPIFKTITDAMMRGMFLPASSKNKSFDMSDIVSDPIITEITSVTPSETDVKIDVGGSAKLTAAVQPSDTNDVVLWKSDDDSIATVYNGLIQGSRIGTTYVTAFSQSGSAQARIKVTVCAKESLHAAQAIILDNMPETYGYVIANGKYDYIKAHADNGENITFTSSNEDVASVNSHGKVVAKSVGMAYITITAETGATYSVPVIVEEVSDQKINVALNVYYNGSYIGGERGKPISITGDGQYTVTFDAATDMSAVGKSAGVTMLKDFGSIYIKDYDVDMGNASRTPVTSCDIRYDEIKVNGQPMTIAKTGFKSALKNTILDTNDPFNAWDGSVVSGDEITTVKNQTVNFKNIDNPAKIEVTFTIRDMEFIKTEEGNPATAITTDIDTGIRIVQGSSMPVSVNVLPAGTTSLVSFISGNEGVLMSDNKGVMVENGVATGTIYGAKVGTTTLTIITDSPYIEVQPIVINVEVVPPVPFSNVTAVVDNDKVTAVTADVNSLPEHDSVTVIAAAYDADGALTDTELKIIQVSDITDTFTADGFDLTIEEGGSVKAFIWTDTETMIPLGE